MVNYGNKINEWFIKKEESMDSSKGDNMILLIVDTQKGITDGRLFAFERLRANIKTLIGQARKHRVEVVYVRHDDGPGTGFSAGDDEFADRKSVV